MNDLRILSKRSPNDRVGHVGPATISLGLRSLGYKTSICSLICLTIGSDMTADLRIFGRP